MKKLRWFLPLTLAIVGILLFVAPVLAAATSWESYTTGENAGDDAYGVYWYGQTFTVTPSSHSVTQIRLMLYRVGTPSTVTVSIRDTDDSGMPTGDDLTSGTIDGDALTTDAAGSWYGVTVTEISLEYGETYAICYRAESGDASNYVVAKVDTSSATYSGGTAVYSESGGISWVEDGGGDDDILFEIYGNSLIAVNGAKVFNSYLEDDDMLIVLSYQNTYAPYYPDETVSLKFWLQLRGTNGTAILAQTVCRQWGYMPGYIYLNANQAASLTAGLPYRVYLTSVAGDASAYYALQSTDWLGDALTLLPSWVLTTARSMATYYDTPMTTQLQNQEVLNSEGGTLFATGIPPLVDTNPDLFQDMVYTPDVNPIEPGGTDFDAATTWEAQVGPDVAYIANLIGGRFEVDGKYAIAGLFFIGYLVICGIVVAAKADPIIGTWFFIPILLGATYLRVIDFQLIAAVGAVAILMTVYRFQWSRT